MKRYFDLTESEKLALSQVDFVSAVEIEGINRGIKPPLKLENAINQVGWTGFTIPADSVIFYELTVPERYGSGKGTGICFRTPAAARAALTDALAVCEEGYGADKKNILVSGDFGVREAYVSLTKPKSLATKLEEIGQDDSEFEKLCLECTNDLSAIRQAKYDAAVRSQKRAQYLSLAQGNEDIAKAFWSKTEAGEFPAE